MGDVSEDSLLRYFHSSGGKVKNSDLLQTFDQFVNNKDLQLRAKHREKFKHVIDRIAVFKVENGEKYLILKKKYKQCMQVQKCQTSSQCPEIVPSTKKEKTGHVEWCVGPSITVTEAQEPNEMKSVTNTCDLMEESPESVIEEHPGSTDAEDELEKDLGSKSESEQEEDSTGSLGSAHVTLDPTEKEWIYHAACGRLSHLKQLLKLDASLANKKDFTSGFTALHWAAKHGKEDMLSAMADAGADVNTKAHGGYTPLHIAALHGHFQIVDLLTRVYGAKENVRDYSGHLASHYMCPLRKTKEDDELTPEYHSPAQVTERRNRKLTSLFHSRKKWGSAEDLAPVPEERSGSHQLMIPAFRPRKFSR